MAATSGGKTLRERQMPFTSWSPFTFTWTVLIVDSNLDSNMDSPGSFKTAETQDSWSFRAGA